ncbi:MAG TPA: hypothetical protein QGF05_08200 [Dehalococcoidia bacterium]|nr:hypothetical protein [Dehalococcoidia bacterium]
MEDYLSAPIPEIHKTLFSWVQRFTHCSWDYNAGDVAALRSAGLTDKDVVDWAQVASLQTWLVMSADGGGVTLDSAESQGNAVGFTRTAYHGAAAGLTAAEITAQPLPRQTPENGSAWVDTDTDNETYQEAASWARDRYGFVPSLLTAESLSPGHYELHKEGLSLLDQAQSDALTPTQHAMVRALVSQLNRSAYSAHTTRQLLLNASGDEALVAAITTDYTQHDLDPDDRLVLDFAAKMARNSYKVVPQDAQAFRDAGLGDEAYVDVLNTTSIQTSQDRLANVLGVTPDAQPLLPL